MSLVQAILEALWDVVVGLSARASARILPVTAPRWQRILLSLLIALAIAVGGLTLLVLLGLSAFD